LIKETINEVANDYKNDDEVDSVLLRDSMIKLSSLCKEKESKNEITGNMSGGRYFSSSNETGKKQLSETEKRTDILNELDVKIIQKEEISKLKIQGAIIRSKSRW